MKYIHFLYISLILALTGILAGCRDDALGDFGAIEEGVASVSVKLSWDRGDEVGIDSRAGDPGDLIQDIKSLYMFIYDKDGNLYKDRYYKVTDENGTHDTELKNVSVDNGDNREDSEKGENGLGDALQGRAQFDMELNRGEYYIYAVANVDVPALDKEKYSTRDKLKAISFNWDPTHTENNSQMFGIFSLNTPNRKATDAAPLRINAKSVMIHSWVRRLASKVTVAFDGTELYDNVQVFIETITIHDIPQSCTLGNENHPGENGIASKDRYNVLHKVGKTITIQDIPEGNDTYITPKSFMHICKTTHPYLGKGDDSTPESVIDDTHAHESESLFFYENMQGTGKSKKQSQEGNKIDFPNPKEDDITSGWKDNKPFGTYIEVVGYYRCVSPDGYFGSGTIKYRYMLGKDDTDYNAERNTHYKLTLKLKGYGNDYDWHIDYKTSVGLQVNTPQYISYLYNKRMNTTVKMVGEIPDGYVLRAEIEECRWKPFGDGSADFPTVENNFCMEGDEADPGPWNSFLSLRLRNAVRIDPRPDLPSWNESNNQYLGGNGKASYNQTYYIENNIGWREYDVSEGQHESNVIGEGIYSVQATKRDGNDNITERVFTIPMFTRAKELLTRSSFTGNNPYYSYPRIGRVKFYICKKDKPNEILPDTEPVYLDIMQVRRVLNPKGVWRKLGSTEKFHVTLMHLNSSDAEKFTPFTSIGKWSAEIVSSSDPIITLTSTPEGSGTGNMIQSNAYRIEGENEKPIDFYINFNGTPGCAIVKVRYHNYTCEHDIFVREGYDPIDVAGKGDQKWSSFNVHHFEKEYNEDGTAIGYKAIPTKSPIEEGSMFRRANYVAILSSNSTKYPKWQDPGSGDFDVIDPDDANTKTKKWSDIKQTISTDEWKITNDNNEHIADVFDVYNDHLVATNANDANFKVAKAYGIVYADGAGETQSGVKTATGYNRTDGVGDERGMLGVIVYNTETCAQIFLPLGTEWNGRRKGKQPNTTNRDNPGTMRYATRSDEFGSLPGDQGANDKVTLTKMPLFFDLYKRPGGIYWFRDRINVSNPLPNQSSALDINFYTMAFEGFQNGADDDACFIRTVFSKIGE